VLEDLTFKSLGLVNYHETMDLMRSHIKEKDFSNEIWLLEHPPIFTLGTAADKKHILNVKDIPIVQSDRGGEVTYHGPGQLVIYFLLDIKKIRIQSK
jgi:lipoyl(octanoyl) transferase